MSEEHEEYQNPPGRGREGYFPELSETMWPYQKTPFPLFIFRKGKDKFLLF